MNWERDSEQPQTWAGYTGEGLKERARAQRQGTFPQALCTYGLLQEGLMLPSPKQTPLRLHPSPGSAPRGPSSHSMHSQLKRIYTSDVLSVICGWRALAVTRGGTKSQGRGGWAGGCPPTTGAHSWAPRHFPCTGCPGGSPNSLSNAAGL